jgi:TRAP-type mannitol/chloroaromatic compound transport system permease small subunit
MNRLDYVLPEWVGIVVMDLVLVLVAWFFIRAIRYDDDGSGRRSMVSIAFIIFGYMLLAVILRIAYRVQVNEHITEFLALSIPWRVYKRWVIDLRTTLSLPIAACERCTTLFKYPHFRWC